MGSKACVAALAWGLLECMHWWRKACMGVWPRAPIMFVMTSCAAVLVGSLMCVRKPFLQLHLHTTYQVEI